VSEPCAGTTASADSSTEASATETASAETTASAKYDGTAASSASEILVVAFLSASNLVTTVSACVGDIFSLHTILVRDQDTAGAQQLMLAAVWTTRLTPFIPHSEAACHKHYTYDN
jgi:hypothetical protein